MSEDQRITFTNDTPPLQPKPTADDIPNRVYDATCLKEYMHCKRRWWFSYRCMDVGIEPLSKNISLAFGSLWHDAKNIYYSHLVEGMSKEDAVEKAVVVFSELEGDDIRRSAEHGEAWFREYVIEYAADTLTPRDVEVRYTLEMPSGASASGKIDLIAEDGPKIVGVDHKTSGSMGQNLIKASYPSIQFRGYAYAIRELVGKCDLFIANGVSTAGKPKQRFQRVPVHFTSKELDRYVNDFTSWTTDIELHLDNDDFPPEDHDCGKWSGCPFQDICRDGFNENLIGVQFRVKEWADETVTQSETSE